MFFNLIAVFLLQPDPASLLRIYEEGLDRRIEQYGVEDTRTAQAARDLGLYLKLRGETDAARTALTRTLEMDEAALGPKALETLKDAAELASISPPGEAAPLWMRASESPEPGVASTAFAALAGLRGAAGDREGAAAYYSRALKAEQAASGPLSPRMAVLMSALAMTVQPEEGIPIMQRALQINRDALGLRHPETATTETNLAGMLVNVGKPDGAVPLLTDAIKVFELTLGPGHPRVASASTVLAYAMKQKGDRVRAEAMYRRALAIDEKAYGPSHEATLADVKHLAEFLREIGRSNEAAVLEKRLK